MGKSVLTLETISPDRDWATIDGKAYFLRTGDELGLMQLSRIRRLSQHVIEMHLTADSSEDDFASIQKAANDILEIIVLDLPSEVRERLGMEQKTAIVEAFMLVASKKRAEKATKESRESQKIMDGSSPGSADSTEVPSTTG